MKKIKYIVVHSSDNTDHKIDIKDDYSRAANAIMNALGYIEYVKKHGYHFTSALADHVSKMMVNVSDSNHNWTTEQIKAATGHIKPSHNWTTEQIKAAIGHIEPLHNETDGDLAYTANMAFADFYPNVIPTVDTCIEYAKAVAKDPDGYEGMEFLRWTSDAIGKSITINWEDFI